MRGTASISAGALPVVGDVAMASPPAAVGPEDGDMVILDFHDGGAVDHREHPEERGGDGHASQEAADLDQRPPAYREEDIMSLKITGKSVYEGEKRALMDVLQDLLAD